MVQVEEFRLEIPWKYLSPKEVFRIRSLFLKQDEPEAWFVLGQWCREHQLEAEAQLSFKKTLARNPLHSEAKALLQKKEKKFFEEKSEQTDHSFEKTTRPPKNPSPLKNTPSKLHKKIELLPLVYEVESLPIATSRPVKEPKVSSNLQVKPSVSGEYKLPFRYGSTFTCSVGNHDGYHKKFGTYAYDFMCAEGTPLYAIRGGRVSYLVEHSTEGGPTLDYVDRANDLWVDHGDGTFSRFAHLFPYSVFVVQGEVVVQGELLALSGNTGFSSGPHLHLEVRKGSHETLIFEFAEAGELKAGSSFPSKNGPNISREEKRYLMETLKEIRNLAEKNSFKKAIKLLGQLRELFKYTGYAEWLLRDQEYLEQWIEGAIENLENLPEEEQKEKEKFLRDELQGTLFLKKINKKHK